MAQISIIICTVNRADSLRETLSSLETVHLPHCTSVELIVVDNGSSDQTSEVINAFIPCNGLSVLRLFEPVRGKSKALNKAIAAANGEILLFSDDDVRFPSDWINDMTSKIIDGFADVVQGGVRWAPHLKQSNFVGHFVYAVIASTEHKTDTEMQHGLIGINMAIHRRVFEALGEFDEELGPGRLGFGEETLFGLRLLKQGFRKVNCFDVTVEHHFDATRLNSDAVLRIAEKKGRSLGYIDYHWYHETVKNIVPMLYFLKIKTFLRTLLTPSAWRFTSSVPPWKYSYTAAIHRLQQLEHERTRPRKYQI